VEFDAKKFGAKAIAFDRTYSLWQLTRLLGIFALAAGMDGWMFKRTTWYEKGFLISAGLALVYPTLTFDIAGLTLPGIAIFCQKVLRKDPL